MKITLFFILFSIQALASQVLFCQQNPRDLLLQVESSGENFKFRVHSPFGFSRMALFEGPIAPGQIGDLQYQADLLKDLKDDFWVEFKAESCQVKFLKSIKGSQAECSGPQRGSSAASLQFHTLSLSHITEESMKGTQDKIKFRLSVETKGPYGAEILFMSFQAPLRGCLLQSSVDKQ